MKKGYLILQYNGRYALSLFFYSCLITIINAYLLIVNEFNTYLC